MAISKQLIPVLVALLPGVFFNSCKTSEENYKKAYQLSLIHI